MGSGAASIRRVNRIDNMRICGMASKPHAACMSRCVLVANRGVCSEMCNFRASCFEYGVICAVVCVNQWVRKLHGDGGMAAAGCVAQHHDGMPA
jgi:hypothetical protein